MTAPDPLSLLALEDEDQQRSWLQQNAPTRDDALIAALEAEAQRRWHSNPQTAFPVAHVVSLAANEWADQEIAAAGMHLEANAHWFTSNHRAALDVYQAATTLYQSLGLKLAAARVAVGQLNAMMYLGQYDAGLQLADQASAIFQAHNDQTALAKMQLNRGTMLYRLGQHQEALAAYDAAQTTFAVQNDTYHVAITQVNAANIHMTLDNFAQAEQQYQQARPIFAAAAMDNLVALVDHNLAELSFYQGEYQQALQQFDAVRQLFVAQGSPVDVAYVDLYRSDIYLALNLWTEALALAVATRPSFAAAEMRWEMGRLWLNEAVALAHLADGRTPDAALSQAHTIFAQEGNPLWLAFTDLYEAVFARRVGNFVLAGQKADTAVAAFRQIGLSSRAAQSLVVAGQAALQAGQLAEAETLFNQALQELQPSGLPAISYACYDGLGQIAQQRGQADDARAHYRTAIAAIERMQAAIGAEDYKIAFLSDKLRVYEAHILLCLAAGGEEDINEAFATVEQAKSRALLDLLEQEVNRATAVGADATLLTELERLKHELNWYYNRLHGGQTDSNERSVQQMQQLTTAVTEREQAIQHLLNRWRRDSAALPSYPIWTISLPHIRGKLPPGTMVLEFYTTQSDILVFGISLETVWSQRIHLSAAELAEALGQLRFQMNKFSYGSDYHGRYAAALRQSADDALHQLYQLVLAPIASLLTADELIIIPHGLLHYVPFHALHDGRDHLLDHKTISYAPSATVLHHMITQDDGDYPTTPLIMGLDDETIPFAQQEAESIAGLFPEAHVYLGEQATIGNMTAHLPDAGLLHLSTHATFRADNPLFSALKLADGWLSVNDFYHMADMPPLVTLSACETGRYQVAVGDELMGLSRGLFAAGARTVVVSLWMVEDETTARLMQLFYAGLRRGEPVHVALRQAQLFIRKESSHPYYWSPFIVIGDVRNPVSQKTVLVEG